MALQHIIAAIQNCDPSKGDQAQCLTTLPTNPANQSSLSQLLNLLFGILAAIAVIIIVIQAIKFALSQGDPQKAADARKGIIYAVVGLAISLTADAIVNVVIKRL